MKTLINAVHNEVVFPTVNLERYKAVFAALSVDVTECRTMWFPHEYIVWPARKLLLRGQEATPANIARMELMATSGCCGAYVDAAGNAGSNLDAHRKRCVLPYGRHDVHRFLMLALTQPTEKQKLLALMQQLKMHQVADRLDGFQIWPETEKNLLDSLN